MRSKCALLGGLDRDDAGLRWGCRTLRGRGLRLVDMGSRRFIVLKIQSVVVNNDD
jgi:hypothetical protein